MPSLLLRKCKYPSKSPTTILLFITEGEETLRSFSPSCCQTETPVLDPNALIKSFWSIATTLDQASTRSLVVENFSCQIGLPDLISIAAIFP